MREEFRSSEGAYETVLRLNKTLKYHHITDIKITESELNNQKKKSKKKEEKSDEILIKYKEQQAAERGFSFLKDPLFFGVVIKMTSSGRTQRGTSFSIKLNIKAE
jgi:transposase